MLAIEEIEFKVLKLIRVKVSKKLNVSQAHRTNSDSITELPNKVVIIIVMHVNQVMMTVLLIIDGINIMIQQLQNFFQIVQVKLNGGVVHILFVY